MNVLKPMPKADGPRVVPTSRDTALPPAIAPGAGRKTFRMFLVAALLVGGGVAFGMWRHSLAEAEVTATSEQRRGIVPAVRVTTVHANDGMTVALLPASTDAFEAANIMARISGYVAKRYVDIGDHVKADQLLAEISAPELDHQIAQAQATLALSEAALNQAKAKREIASVTWNRDSNLAGQGWITSQQADTERLNLRAQEAAVTVAQANIRAQQAQLEVLLQLKAYQRVVAPFDGVVTQRNIDNGSLMQADIAGGVPMFTVMHSDVIRVQTYVPQDQVSGLQKGVGAIVRVPEMPRKTESLIVPAEAVIFSRNGLSVAIVENGTVHLRELTVARDRGTTLEVTAGVKDGDQVIINPPGDISEGRVVRPQLVEAPNG
jgi:multidrug efflux pump subunit AcrA (membrane-fusion protein)